MFEAGDDELQAVLEALVVAGEDLFAGGGRERELVGIDALGPLGEVVLRASLTRGAERPLAPRS